MNKITINYVYCVLYDQHNSRICAVASAEESSSLSWSTTWSTPLVRSKRLCHDSPWTVIRCHAKAQYLRRKLIWHHLRMGIAAWPSIQSSICIAPYNSSNCVSRICSNTAKNCPTLPEPAMVISPERTPPGRNFPPLVLGPLKVKLGMDRMLCLAMVS